MSHFLDDLHIPFRRDVPLGPLTWYGVGGSAQVLAQPSSVQQLSALAQRCHQLQTPVYVLGGGANLLVRDTGVPGVVVQLSSPAFRQMKIQNPIVTAGAGYELQKLVLETARAGLAGLECLAGIPASVGGAVRMNAGGTFGEIGRCVRRVQVMDATGYVYHRERDDLHFGYRRSDIAARFILEVEFELEPDDPDRLARRVKELYIYKSQAQPLGEHSAGCVFKNPHHPHHPHHPQPRSGPPTGESPQAPTSEHHPAGVPAGEDLSPGIAAVEARPVSAGQLIDRCGLKGFRIGGAEVSKVHANFVVAGPSASAADILAVIEHVERVVLQQTGVRLERELVVWP